MRNPDRDDRDFLQDILERIQRIETFVEPGYAEFLESHLIQDAVQRNFEVIGEATKRLSPTLRDRYPDVPWQQIAEFRDVIIHDYMGLQLEQIWATIEQSLPPLKIRIHQILQALDTNP
jgi:uncharacterized protein with HEPN domain